ncbi:MAG: head GIN domain-containing protein [Bacteroidales bacterium]|nr:head GIN domain-containing protein [Bacteroidales bacterium]
MKKSFLITIAVLIVAISSCSCLDFVSINPSGPYTAKKINVGSFENVSVSNGFELILTQDPNQELVIETYENIHDYIVVRVDGSTLKIYREGGIFFSGNSNVKIYLSCNHLEKITGSGGSRIYLENGWEGDQLKVSLSGGGRITGAVELNSLYLSMSGGSRSELEGSVGYFSINSSGGSVHKHYGLKAEECRASLSGGASAELFVSELLDVTGSGGTTVRYKGDPHINTKLSGGSSVRKVN